MSNNLMKEIKDVFALALITAKTKKLDARPGVIPYVRRAIRRLNDRPSGFKLDAVADRQDDCIFIKPMQQDGEIKALRRGSKILDALAKSEGYNEIETGYVEALEHSLSEISITIPSGQVRATIDWLNGEYDTGIVVRRTRTSYFLYKRHWLNGRDFDGAVAKWKMNNPNHKKPTH